jgi:hypothetical protein
VANVVISNVPGPPVPLYMAGAKMLTNYPCSIVVHGVALNITVQSYDQSLDFGLMADAAAMPEVRELADSIRVAFDDVRALPVDEPEDQAPTSATAMAQDAARSAGMAIRRVAGAALDSASDLVGKPVQRAARKALKGAMTGAVGGAVGSAVSGAMARVVKAASRKRPT